MLLFSRIFDAQLYSRHWQSILVYLACLIFQLWSHTHLYKDQHNKSNRLSVVIREDRLRGKAESQRKIPLSQIDTPTIRVHNEASFSEPHRPFVLPLRSAGSDIRLVHPTDESFNSAPIELVQTNIEECRWVASRHIAIVGYLQSPFMLGKVASIPQHTPTRQPLLNLDANLRWASF